MVVNRSYGVSTQSLSSFLQLTTSSTKSHLLGNWYYSISKGNRRRLKAFGLPAREVAYNELHTYYSYTTFYYRLAKLLQ
jgi:hypothetical protein